ncbi:MAG: hypothetical protein MCSN_5350 [Candidatus Microsyncoccus archaeolyticus]|nr:MAG: hypothetical protein MCSN_5350 [Candidatus Parcubacteria bacterium]
MAFQVPQFIEHDPKILGPFTLSQSLYIGSALGISFLLYFSLAETNFFLYVLVSGLVFGIAIALAFVKIEGLKIPLVIKNFVNFNLNTKIYKWERKETPVFLPTKKSEKQEPVEEKTKLKIKPNGRIDDLNKKIYF